MDSFQLCCSIYLVLNGASGCRFGTGCWRLILNHGNDVRTVAKRRSFNLENQLTFGITPVPSHFLCGLRQWNHLTNSKRCGERWGDENCCWFYLINVTHTDLSDANTVSNLTVHCFPVCISNTVHWTIDRQTNRPAYSPAQRIVHIHRELREIKKKNDQNSIANVSFIVWIYLLICVY